MNQIPINQNTSPSKIKKSKLLLWGVLPLVLLIAIIAVILTLGPGVEEASPVPIENMDIEKMVLNDKGITLKVLNSGPEELTIAQVMVDDAYWNFNIAPNESIARMNRATITIPYPWVEGDAHEIRLISSNSTIFDQGIDIAFETPQMNGDRIGRYALIGLYVGVIPVALGLLWYPLMRRFSMKGTHAILAFTAGLLIFLLIDTFEEGLEFASEAPSIFNGTGLVWFGALLSFLFLLALEGPKKTKGRSDNSSGKALSYKLATGIGLHNFGEGLAIGTAFAVGEAALGTFLIIGFTLHNMTEGIGIAAPLTKEQPSWRTFVWLALIGGGPAILGVWSGGMIIDKTLAALFFGIGAGAIAQVIYVIARMIGKESLAQSRSLLSWRNFSSVLLGIGVMYATALLV
jgi:ZIP family zinc transporter